MLAFSIFIFAPVQRNSACFTWKSALEIRSLLLSLLLLLKVHTIHSQYFSKAVMYYTPLPLFKDSLAGPVFEASISRAEDPGCNSRMRRDFSGPSIPVT